MGEGLHRCVLQIAAPEAEHAEVGAGIAFVFDVGLKTARIAEADVEIAVRGEDDAGHVTIRFHGFGECVGLFETALAVGRPTCIQRV